jgi:hypothetical protein
LYSVGRVGLIRPNSLSAHTIHSVTSMDAKAYRLGKVFKTFPDLDISSYQRTIVWKPKQRAAFVRSILAGYPTGLIVLNRTSRSSVGPVAIGGRVLQLRTIHDVIDGQQRLTTSKEFLDHPLRYFLDWQKNPPQKGAPPETPEFELVRRELTLLVPALRKKVAGFRAPGTSREAFFNKIEEKTMELLQHKARSGSVPPSWKHFEPVVVGVERLIRSFSTQYIAIAALKNLPADESESIYRAINTSGTPLTWWQLLAVDHSFSRAVYPSSSGYHTLYDSEVRSIAGQYRIPGGIHSQVSTHDSFWHAIFAVGERFQYGFANVSGAGTGGPLPGPKTRRLNVDGLGFRLVSGLLSHNIGLSGVDNLFKNFSDDEIRRAIDVLFDTAELLFNPGNARNHGFALFSKYGRFKADVIPAYPLLAILLASANLVAINSANNHKRVLNPKDGLNLRCLTEELLRESLCTTKWAGSGDSKLKSWLDDHFVLVTGARQSGNASNFPGKLRKAAPTYDVDQWLDMVEKLEPTDQRMADKRSMLLHFWVQYLFDSKVQGCLPTGTIHFDHIVSFQKVPSSPTTHPLNIAAIAQFLNDSKGSMTYNNWAASTRVPVEYRLQTLDGVNISSRNLSGPAVSFLAAATHATLPDMLDARKEIFEFAVKELVPAWISDGD